MRSDVLHVIENGESETAEFKSSRSSFEALARAVCGMLNQQGGVLLWGVDDTGQLTGVEDAEAQAEDLTHFLMRHMNPRPLLSVSVHEAKGKPIIMVDVPSGSDKPYSLGRQILVRIGSRTMRAGVDESAALVEQSAIELERWEREPMPGFAVEDCDVDELEKARSEIAQAGRFGIDAPASDEELLQRLYLWRNGQVTNAGVVLFASQPRMWVPNVFVRVVSYAEGKAGPIANDVIVDGPAVRSLREVVTIIQQRTGFSGRFVKGKLKREDRPAYSVFALREGLVNAITHRSYEVIGGSVCVEIFPDRLVIRNPGRLPDGWTAQDLRRVHGSHPFNPDIAQVFLLRGLMEQLGMGTQKLMAACKELGAKLPVWRVEQGTVALTIFQAPEPEAADVLTGRQAEFVGSLMAGAEFRAADYLSATGMSERQGRRDLAELEKRGIIERHGKGRATVYRRTDGGRS